LFPSLRRLAATAALLAAPSLARAGAVLDVSGSVLRTSPRLEVRVVVTNRGDAVATPLDVSGELFGERRLAHLAAGVPAGGSAAVVLDFPPSETRPGVHALALLLEHPIDGAPDAAGNPPMASQRAWLLLALGATTEPAVTLSPEPLRLLVRGSLVVRVESTDAAPHRVWLRVLTARGLRTEGPEVRIAVPAKGAVRASVSLVRAGAPRGSRHEVVLVAEAEDGPLARTTVATAAVEVAPDLSLLARLRVPVAILGFLLLATAVGVEIWWRHPRAPAP
jgi:hypothetical protein